MRLGIFGGTFDPIHAGHVRVARRAAADYALDRVLVIPAACSPFKTESARTLGDALRWRLVRAACAPYPELEPCDIELKRGGVSYAIDTVRAIAARYPGAELFSITGEDAFAGLPKWHESEALRKLARFVTFPRTPESSTQVRARLLRGESVAELLTPEVNDFLASRGIVFDYGGVLAYAPKDDWGIWPLCAKEGLGKDAIKAGFSKYRTLWDGGFKSGRETYRQIFADNGLHPTDAALDAIVDADSIGWTRICADSLALIKDLKALGKKIGILTNMSVEFHDGYFVKCARDYAALADARVVSGFEKLYKPERPIYDLMAARIALAPSELLFLDDNAPNVEAARRYGWKAQVFHAE